MTTTPKSQDEGQTEEAYLASYESANRKRKMLIIIVAVAAILLVVAAFVGTLGSLGKMNEDVQGAFTENPDGTPVEEAGTPNQQGSMPAEGAPSTNPPAESATPAESTPETNAAPADSTPAPTETAPTPAP